MNTIQNIIKISLLCSILAMTQYAPDEIDTSKLRFDSLLASIDLLKLLNNDTTSIKQKNIDLVRDSLYKDLEKRYFVLEQKISFRNINIQEYFDTDKNHGMTLLLFLAKKLEPEQENISVFLQKVTKEKDLWRVTAQMSFWRKGIEDWQFTICMTPNQIWYCKAK